MINLLETPLLKALKDDSLSFHDVMNAFDIKVSIAFNLSQSVYGFVYLSNRKGYLLVLNGNINYETQCKVFLHEIKHIIKDMPHIGYIIGLDMQHTDIETNSSNFIISYNQSF